MQLKGNAGSLRCRLNPKRLDLLQDGFEASFELLPGAGFVAFCFDES
jgi:hypothetical protein